MTEKKKKKKASLRHHRCLSQPDNVEQNMDRSHQSTDDNPHEHQWWELVFGKHTHTHTKME